jgi:hypothetical protein
MIRTSCIALLAIAATGCAGLDTEAHQAYAEAQALAATQPTLELNCPSGCTASYTDPRDKRIAIPQPTNAYDVMNTALGVAGSMAPWYAVSNIAVEGLRSAQGDTAVTQDNDRTRSTTTRDDTYGDAAAVAERRDELVAYTEEIDWFKDEFPDTLRQGDVQLLEKAIELGVIEEGVTADELFLDPRTF